MKIAVCLNDFPVSELYSSCGYFDKGRELEIKEDGYLKLAPIRPIAYPHFFFIEDRFWIPGSDEFYFYINTAGDVDRDTGNGLFNGASTRRGLFGNCFQYRQQAEARVEAVSKALKGI